jgi:glycosyltransferase involved in cell wall biosynthesis
MSLVHRIWQTLPRGLRRGLLFGGMAALAPRPSRYPDRDGPVTVAGFLSTSTGLGIGAQRMLAAMRDQGLDPRATDLTSALRQGGQAVPMVPPAPGPGTLILHVNGPMLPWAMRALGRRAVAGKRIIAVWAWELPRLPADWSHGFRFAHEIWVGSRFVAEAVEAAVPLPVRVVPYPVPAPDPSPRGRADFGLPEDAFVSLVMFDASSSIARKNPMAAIRAHRAAFGDRPDRLLVLKTHSTAQAGAAWDEIAAIAAATPNIRVVDATLPEPDRWALMRAADAVLSLHRAEGYGLAIAEAMRLGRAVIATEWSGNTDFMHGPGCFGVPARLVPAEDPQATYHHPEMCWAEPDEAAAAAALRRLADSGPRSFPPVPFPVPDYAALIDGSAT